MPSILNPNSGPSRGRMSDQGVLIDAAKEGFTPLTSGVPFVTRSVLGTNESTGFTLNIRCDVNGNFVIRGLTLHGDIYTLQASTAYTASNGTVFVNFSRFILEAYVEFTPSSTSNDLYIEAFAYGRGY
jgi:hypothetical protein